MATPSVVAREVAKMGRVLRRPQHTFQIRSRPWQIQPFMIAPVLPGETLKNAMMQARVVTDPVASRLLGWWNEYYWFYVKHRDLDDRDEFVNMVLDPDWSKANVDATAASVETYFAASTGGKIDWVSLCLKRVVEEYFRNEGETWDGFKVGNLPAAAVTGNTWLQSTVNEADLTFPDVDVDSNADDTITVGEIDQARLQYEFLKQNFAVEMTYDDFLRTYGVGVAKKEELHVPELIRFVRDWSYPVSAIDPADGSAASAVTWSVQERIDKDRFFKEPGFIFGVSVCRPKVYFKQQQSTASTLLDDAFAWLPAVLTNDLRTSLKLVADTDGPLGDVTDANGYWVDVRDLFMYGEQFINFALTETDAGLVALPTAGLQKRYADATDADAMFANAASANLIRQDGICTLNIAGRQVDQST